MPKLIRYMAILVAIYTIGFAQPPILWIRTYGGPQNEEAWSVDETSDGGFIIAGYTSSYGFGGDDVYLVRVDPNGDTLWTRTYGGSSNERAFCVRQTSDGGFILIGWTESFGSGNKDLYLIKTDSIGNLLWQRTFGGYNRDEGYSVEETSDGGYILVGFTKSFGPGATAVYLIKTDQNGDSLWTRTYGGGYVDAGYDVKETTDGGFIITGETCSCGDINGDVLLLKTDQNGNGLWLKYYGGNDVDFGRSLDETEDGGYIVCGRFTTANWPDVNIWLLKTDINGDTLWTKQYGGSYYEEGHSVQQTSDGGYIFTGYTESYGAGLWDVWLVKTDFLGNILWAETFGDTASDWGNCVKETSDGGYIVAGQTKSFIGYWQLDFYVIHLGQPVDVREKSTPKKQSNFVIQIENSSFTVSNQSFFLKNPSSYGIEAMLFLPEEHYVEFKLFNSIGRKILNFGGVASPGWNRIQKRLKIPSGIYFLMVVVGNKNLSKKLIYLNGGK
jgi:hypothetical protein